MALLRLCAAIDRSDVDLRVILLSDGPLRERLEAIGVPVEVLVLDADVTGLNRYAAGRLSMANLRRFALMVPFVWRLSRRVRQLRPDVVQTNTLKTSLFGLVVAPLAGRPLVWYLHDRIADDYLPGALVRVIRAAARLPRAVIANSEASAATIAPRRCALAYPGYAPEQRLASLSDRVEPERTVVGLLGRISPTKGQLEFVRAAAKILQRHPETTFRIVGSPMFGAEDYADQVRAEVRALGIEPAVEFAGFADDPLAEIDGFSVLVHASPVPEPFGQVIVEAMIRGVPVVASRAGGAIEIVNPSQVVSGAGLLAGELGLLAEPGDVGSLAAAVSAVLGDPAAARGRAVAGFESATERFAVSRTADVVCGVWRGVAARRRGGRRRRAPARETGRG